MLESLKNLSYNLLRESEKYFKTDMVYLAKGSFWLILGQVASAVASLGLSIAFAYFLTQDEYGNYKFILSLASIVGAVSLTGISTSVIQSTSQGYEGSLKYSFWQNIKWSVPMILSAIGISTYYFLNDNNLIAISMIIIAFLTPIINSFLLYGAFLNGRKLFKENTVCWMTGVVFSAITLIITIIFTSNLIVIISVYFASNAIANGIFYAYTNYFFKPNSRIKEGTLRYSIHLSFLNLLNTITNQIDKVLIFHYLGASQLAIYSFSLAIPDQIRAVLKSSARLALPKFAERGFDEIRLSLVPKMTKFGVIIILITIVYIAIAPTIFKILFPKYFESIIYSQIISITIFTVLGSLPLAAFQAHSNQKQLYVHTISTNILQILIMIIFIKYYGLLGAVLAVVMNRFLFLIIPTFLFLKIRPQDAVVNMATSEDPKIID